MNYRHIYHAGNICDVVKHGVLTLLLRHLAAKPKPFFVLDTHAGLGRYDLEDPRALKTGEAEAGVRRLLANPTVPLLADYYRLVRELNPSGGLRLYPGSPLIARRMLRNEDRLALCELHPDDAHELKQLFAGDRQVQVHRRDGYEALLGLLPPVEKRGLVLIDPPFERTDEAVRLVEAVETVHKRFPLGHVAIWYPIKERPALWRFHEALAATEIPKILVAEFVYDDETRQDRLNGSGFVFVNPPYGLEGEMRELLPQLQGALETTEQSSKLFWLTPL